MNTIFDSFSSGRDAVAAEFISANQPVPWLWGYLCDSTNVMRAARVMNPNVVGYGCPSHASNNFCKDFAKNPVVAGMQIYLGAESILI